MRIQQIVSILFALFLLICPFILVYFHEVWSVFSSIYVIIAVSFIWLSMSLLFIVDMKKVKARIMDLTMEYSVVIPCYNESYDTLTQCITSVMDSRGRKQVIIANDGSTSQETKDALITIKNTYGGFIDILNFEENRGKKFAQIDAIKQCKYDYCITLDSDTIVEQDTFLKLVNPLKNNEIGLTNVNVKIKNKNKNLMTKMQELHNYGAFMIGRKSLGGLGIMNCASGIGIGFRKSTFMDFAKEYLDKRPFGFDCKFGEDRYMTNIMLKNRYKVIMIEDAIAHTFVPETLSMFVKQQCLPFDEKIWAKSEGRVSKIKIGDLFGNKKLGWNNPDKKVYVYTFDKITMKSSWKKIIGLLKKESDELIYEIKLRNGRTIKVSKNHPMLVPNKKEFIKKSASELKEGDFIPCIKNFNIEENKELYGFKNYLELAEFIGFYLAEGCTDIQSIRLAFNYKTEHHIAKNIQRIINTNMGANSKIVKQTSCWVVRCYSKKGVELIKNMNLGSNAHNKKIPDWIFEQSDEFIIKLLESYFIGDGHFRRRKIGVEMTASSVSKELIQGISLLFSKIGIIAHYRKSIEKSSFKRKDGAENYTRYIIRISGGFSNSKTINLFQKLTKGIKLKPKKLQNSASNSIPTSIIDRSKWKKTIIKANGKECFYGERDLSAKAISYHIVKNHSIDNKYLDNIRNGDIALSEIKSIKILPSEKYLYDIEVEDNHNFASGDGIFTNNCRWKISGIIEGIHVLTFSWKTSITLFIYSLLNIMLPFMCQVVILTIILSTILLGEYINLLYFAIVIIMATLVRDTVIILEERRLIKYIVPYSILNLTVLLWLWWFALWRIDEKSWITR